MSDLYRLYDDDKDGDGKLGDYLLVVPDTRLQAIADAQLCEHDCIDEHYADWEKGPEGKAIKPWCEGAPVLRALLDELGGTDKHKEVCRHQFIPVFTLKSGSSYTECIECGRAYQYDY